MKTSNFFLLLTTLERVLKFDADHNYIDVSELSRSREKLSHNLIFSQWGEYVPQKCSLWIEHDKKVIRIFHFTFAIISCYDWFV